MRISDWSSDVCSSDLRLITAFNAIRARLLAMLDEKDRMLGAIGHDLRTPLASLRVRTESVEDEGERARLSETIQEVNRVFKAILSLATMQRCLKGVQKVDMPALAAAVVWGLVHVGGDVVGGVRRMRRSTREDKLFFYNIVWLARMGSNAVGLHMRVVAGGSDAVVEYGRGLGGDAYMVTSGGDVVSMRPQRRERARRILIDDSRASR